MKKLFLQLIDFLDDTPFTLDDAVITAADNSFDEPA
jgi:hypothetical protein